jgi:hypothetical protein
MSATPLAALVARKTRREVPVLITRMSPLPTSETNDVAKGNLCEKLSSRFRYALQIVYMARGPRREHS